MHLTSTNISTVEYTTMDPATQANLQVIFMKNQAYGNLTSIHVTSRDTLGSTVARLKKLCFPENTLRRIMFALYMAITSQKFVVSTTDIASVSETYHRLRHIRLMLITIQISWLDLEASPHSSRVFVQQPEFDSLLTSACLDAHLLSSSKPFAQLYPQLCSFSGRTAASKALVLSLRLSPSKAAALLLVITAAAMLIGLAWGIRLHNLEAGLSVSASILGVISVLQGCVLWLRINL